MTTAPQLSPPEATAESFVTVQFGALQQIRRLRCPDDFQAIAGADCVVVTADGELWGRVLSQGPSDLGVDARLSVRTPTERDEARRAQVLGIQAQALVLFQRLARAQGFEVLALQCRLTGSFWTVYYYCAQQLAAWRVVGEAAKAELGPLLDGIDWQHGPMAEDLIFDWQQVGARVKAKLCGGVGVCGRELCCSTFLRDLRPVPMRTARRQSRSLLPGDTAGVCGRLKCCLRYEDEFVDATEDWEPKKGQRLRVRLFEGTIQRYDCVRRTFVLQDKRGRQREFFYEERKVLL